MGDKLSTEEILRFIEILNAFPGVSTHIRMQEHTHRRIFEDHAEVWGDKYGKVGFPIDNAQRGVISRPRLPIHRWQERGSDIRVFITADIQEGVVIFGTWRDQLQVCFKSGVHSHEIPGKCPCPMCMIEQIHTV